MLLARRFHNDAVRDTLPLRERPMVRLLHLGGTAALPSYFEIAERAGARGARPGQFSRRVSAQGHAPRRGRAGCCCSAASTRPARRRHRAALVVHRRRRGRAGEELAETAVRGTGRGDRPGRCPAADLLGPVWRREAIIDFNGSVMRSEELFFVHRDQPLRALRTAGSYRPGAPLHSRPP